MADRIGDLMAQDRYDLLEQAAGDFIALPPPSMDYRRTRLPRDFPRVPPGDERNYGDRLRAVTRMINPDRFYNAVQQWPLSVNIEDRRVPSERNLSFDERFAGFS